MAFDLALNPATGDLVFSGNRDIQGISGPNQVAQRIHIRLMVRAGEWIYDKDKSLGSYLPGTLQHARERVLNELPLLIEQALSPMTDVTIQEVEIEPPAPEDTKVRVHIYYTPRTEPRQVLGETQSLGAVAFLEVPIL
jgi:hypothetical protein